MERKNNISAFSFIMMGTLLLVFISCKKDEDNAIKTGSFTDSRDGNIYKTITIGNQVWMAENLRYLPSIVGSATGSETIPNYYVYGYNGTNVNEAKSTANYKTYGALYNWEAAKIACPAGWHLPSNAEWTTLISYLGGEEIAGGKLKETGTTLWENPNTGATNEIGFSALPSGGRTSNGTFVLVGFAGYWWSATEGDTGYAWNRYMYCNNCKVGCSYGALEVGYSVRCIRD